MSDYEAVIADLEAKRDKITATIELLRELQGGGATDSNGDAAERDPASATPGPSRVPRAPTPASASVQNDTFFGLSTPLAIRKFLGMTKRPQKIPDIAKALLEGGQIHARDMTTSYNNVYAALKRMRKSGEAVRIKSGEWALAEWYASKPGKTEGE